MSKKPTSHANSLANLVRWKPGQSGNPSGKPATDRDLRELCRNLTPEIVASLRAALTRARDAVPAANVLLAYGFGRPVQTQNVRIIRSMEDLSDAELRALAGISEGEELGDETRH